jgi:hypothetical protein
MKKLICAYGLFATLAMSSFTFADDQVLPEMVICGSKPALAIEHEQNVTLENLQIDPSVSYNVGWTRVSHLPVQIGRVPGRPGTFKAIDRETQGGLFVLVFTLDQAKNPYTGSRLKTKETGATVFSLGCRGDE